jgi:transposase-like protein
MALAISHKDLADSIVELREAEAELAELTRRVAYLRMTVDGMGGLIMLACTHENAESDGDAERWRCLECGARFQLELKETANA